MLILKTDGGAHPPEKWADATAQIIFPLADIRPDRIVLARKTQLAIMEALIGHHGQRQEVERGHLKAKGDDHLTAANDAREEALIAFGEIQKIVQGTPWEEHFTQTSVQQEVINTIAIHMQTISHIERSWHCDRNPGPLAQAWLAAHHPGA